MKYYTDKGRDGQDKLEKTCRKTQHVKIGMERDVSIIICRMAAVGENYNSTRDRLILVLTGYTLLISKYAKANSVLPCVALLMLSIHSCSDPQLLSPGNHQFMFLLGTSFIAVMKTNTSKNYRMNYLK